MQTTEIAAPPVQTRTIDIRKMDSEFFFPSTMIERATGFTAQELREESFLRGVSRDRFVDRLAYHYDQLNYVHPFREGNGRTQRLFWDRIAHDAGWEIDWQSVQGSVNNAACQAAAERQDLAPLRAMFSSVVAEAGTQARLAAAHPAKHIAELASPAVPSVQERASFEPPQGAVWTRSQPHREHGTGFEH